MGIKERTGEIKKAIEAGATWPELEGKFGATTAWLQACLKGSLSEEEYRNVLATARKNSKAKKVIYIAETGALLACPNILNNASRVFAPDFCKKELQHLGQGASFLNNPKMCWADIKWDPIKRIEGREMKPRTFGIVSFCCTMARRNQDAVIKVYTNSKEVVTLLTAQNVSNVKIKKY